MFFCLRQEKNSKSHKKESCLKKIFKNKTDCLLHLLNNSYVKYAIKLAKHICL